MRDATATAQRVGVLDRNHSPGSGGIFWQEVAASLRGRSDLLLQDYVVGLGGGDVTEDCLSGIADDLSSRSAEAEPVWEEVAL